MRISLIPMGSAEKRLLFVNSLPESSFVSRGATAFEIFWRGVPPVETVLAESCDSGRRIERSADFRGASYPLESARRSRRSESPAPIPDQGLSCTCPI
jgi:hypothetical protein